MTLDERLGRAAQNLRNGVEPEVPDFDVLLGRDRRSRLRRRTALGGLAVVVMAVAVLVPVLTRGGPRPTVVHTAAGSGAQPEPSTGAVAVPSVVGLDKARAVQILTQVGLDTSLIGRTNSPLPLGTVIAQTPRAGSLLARGGQVTLTVSVAGVPLEAVDWSAVSYPVDCGGRTVGTVAGYTDPVVGRHLAVLYVQCEHGAGNPPSAVLVYDGASSTTEPALLQVLVSYQDDWSPVPGGVSFRGTELSVHVHGYTGATARCCPDIDTTLTWTWDGTAYREQSNEPAHETLLSSALDGDGIGYVLFGQAQTSAVSTLSGMLGQPAHGSAAGQPNCGFDSEVDWPGLVAFFDRGTFVGYTASRGGESPVADVTLVTAVGLQLGDSLDEASHLYGSALSTSSAQGGVWFVTTSQGRVMGFLSAEPNHSGSAPTITSIEAGVVGCPAETP